MSNLLHFWPPPVFETFKPRHHSEHRAGGGGGPRHPEPCCVPENMSSLSILFFDEDKNVVLKVYPNMTVDSCACR